MKRSAIDRMMIGDALQLAGARRLRYIEGKAHGTETIEVSTGGGLVYEVLPGRGMDLFRVSYRGTNLTYLMPGAPVDSRIYQPRGYGWLSSFNGGLLATCGLRNAGEPCVEDHMEYGLHGTISNTAAEEVTVETGESIRVKGRIIDAVATRGALVLERTITSYVDANKIEIRDAIANFSSERQLLMVTYHINFGFPLLSPSSIIRVYRGATKEFDCAAKPFIEKVFTVEPPQDGRPERTFLHWPDCPQDKGAFLIADNANSPSYAVLVTYQANELPCLGVNHLYRPREYMLSLEPSNNSLRGRVWEREHGNPRYLQAGERLSISLDIEVMSNPESIKDIGSAIESGYPV